MRVTRSFLNGIVSLVVLGALVLMGMGSSVAWTPSTSMSPSGPPGVHQTPQFQSPFAPFDLRTPGAPFQIAEEVSSSKEAEIKDAAGSLPLSASSTLRSLTPGQTCSTFVLRASPRRLCVLLCVFLC